MSTAEEIAKVGRVFSPSSPIDTEKLFAGRKNQLERIVDVASTKGQHAIVFGERGVGKTSIANVAAAIVSHVSSAIVSRINCTGDDTFENLWERSLESITFTTDSEGGTMGLVSSRIEIERDLLEHLKGPPSPHSLRVLLSRIGHTVFIFDEFDRIADQSVTRLFADTIKTFSDAAIDSTIVVVGVADSVDELLREHQSVDRALVQVLMPRMDDDELHDILKKASQELAIDIEPEAAEFAVLLSQGLPHYTHLLGKAAFQQAIRNGSRSVSTAEITNGIESAITDTQQKVRSSYQQATTSPHPNTIFRQVLLACAMAKVDELGFFAASDVRGPLTKVMGKPYEIPNFAQHLNKFSSSVRGDILEKVGTTRKFRFRFRNPLFQPYVLMRGVKDGLLTDDPIKVLRDKTIAQES